MPPQMGDLLARVDQCSTQAHELSAHFEELRDQIRQAISIAQLDPEMSLARSRKVLEYIIRDIYDDALKPKRAGTQPLEGLVQTLVKEGQFPVRLAAYADMVRGLGNVGVHAFDKGVSSQDVLNSLSNLLPIVEWFFEHRKTHGAAEAPAQPAIANGTVPAVQPPRPEPLAGPAVPQPAVPQPAVARPAVARPAPTASQPKPQPALGHPQPKGQAGVSASTGPGTRQPAPTRPQSAGQSRAAPPLPPASQQSAKGATPSGSEAVVDRAARPMPQARQVAPGLDSSAAQPLIAPARPKQNHPPAKTPAAAPRGKPAADSSRRRTMRWVILGAVMLAAGGIWYFTHRSDSHGGAALNSGDPTRSFVVAALETKTNSLGMKLTLIPAGEFMMGSPDGETGAEANEHPRHRVRITKPFYLGIYSVTRGQFGKFVAATNYQADKEKVGKRGANSADDTAADASPQKSESTWRDPGFPQTDEHPVVNVSWNGAVAFCKWLSDQEGRRYRLPTEAEWEYACREGTTSAYFFGDNPADLAEFAHIGSHDFTAPVGSLRPNPFGLYDIIGNTWQWCSDWYGADYYKNSLSDDPPGPLTGTERVERGGSWRSGPARCRCAVRDFFGPGHHGFRIGFRVVCER